MAVEPLLNAEEAAPGIMSPSSPLRLWLIEYASIGGAHSKRLAHAVNLTTGDKRLSSSKDNK